jgi:hypothetical protein
MNQVFNQEPTMTDTTTPTEPIRKNREIVLQCITDLCEHNQGASRVRVVELTGLKMSTVDEQVERLKADGLIRTLYAGVYEPIDQMEDRAISTTALPRGRMKLEIGDLVIDLTPRECLALAKQFAGHLLVFRAG